MQGYACTTVEEIAHTHRHMRDEAPIADVGAAAGEVGLDVERAQHPGRHAFVIVCCGAAHDEGGRGQEVRPKFLHGHGAFEGPGPPVLQLVVQERPPGFVLAAWFGVCVYVCASWW